MKNIKEQSLYFTAKKLIPGGTQLLSKRPEMFLPGAWPTYYSKAKGVDVWDLKNKKYIDMSYSGIGSCVLGYADQDVDAAAIQAIKKANMTTLNCPEEVDLAKILCNLHSWADMARFTRTGGEASAMAIRIARAATGKDKIAFCGYHGWHDWYLAANLSQHDCLKGHLLSGLEAKGVPKGLKGTALPFRHNNLDDFKKLVAQHDKQLAAIIMEPVRYDAPQKGFLREIRKAATQKGIALIFDEISAGFRLACGGSHLIYGVNPDIAIFGKGISNGYPMGAVIGKKKWMQAAQETFISSTYWTDRIGPTAALATIKKFKKCKVENHLIKIGKAVQGVWGKAAKKNGIGITVKGQGPLSTFSFDEPKSQEIKTLFVQLMLEQGILATNAFYACYAHQDKHVLKYQKAVNKAFQIIAKAINDKNVKKYLKTKIAHKGFQRLT